MGSKKLLTLDEVEEEMKKRNVVSFLASLPGYSSYSLYGVLRHPIEATFIRPFWAVVYFFQRGWRGFGDNDAWSISYYLNSWMPAAVRRLKHKTGVPGMLIEEMFPSEITDERMDQYRRQWKAIVESIARGFESSRELEETYPPFGSPERIALEKEREVGLQLFVKYYEALWD